MSEGPLKNKNGVTMMEIIILVSVISLFIVALIPLVTENMVANSKAKIRLNAYEAAHKKVEELRNTSFSSLVSGTFSTPTVQGGSGTVTIYQDIDGDGSNEANIIKAKVDVSYTDKDQAKTVTLTTLIAK